MDRICTEDAHKVMAKMKNMYLLGQDEILMEAWKCLGNREVDFLTGLFNVLLQVERITE